MLNEPHTVKLNLQKLNTIHVFITCVLYIVWKYNENCILAKVQENWKTKLKIVSSKKWRHKCVIDFTIKKCIILTHSFLYNFFVSFKHNTLNRKKNKLHH